MNKIIALILLFCIANFSVVMARKSDVGQDTSMLKALRMAKYERDTSASAVVLEEVVTTSVLVAGDFFRRFTTVSQKIKILTNEGLNYGKYTIPVYNQGGGTENEIYNIKGNTYNIEEGGIKISSLKESEIYNEILSKNISAKKFEMPDTKAGSVITVTYTIKTDNISNFAWNFQRSIPVIYDQLKFSSPPLYEYEVIEQNMEDCVESKTLDDKTFTYFSKEYQYTASIYTSKNIPAFKSEAYMTTPEDYIQKIRFQLAKRVGLGGRTRDQKYTNSWSQLSRELMNSSYFGDYIDDCKHKVDDAVKLLRLEGMTEMEKVKAIINYVKDNYKWNQRYSLLATRKMKDFIADKAGTSGDINLFLVALFRSAKLNAWPVLISTRNHGKVDGRYPFLDFFNNVICFVKTDSVALLVDASEKELPFYTIPFQCLNKYGFVVRTDSVKWVSLEPNASSSTNSAISIQFSPGNDSLSAGFFTSASGYSADILRQAWNKNYEAFTALISKHNEVLNDSVKVQNADKSELPFIATFTITFPLLFVKSAESGKEQTRILFPPLLSEPIQENPLRADDRKYPVDMGYGKTLEYHSTITIPKGYRLEEKPGDYSYSTKDSGATFVFNIKLVTDNYLQVYSKMVFNKHEFQPSEYKQLKLFFDLAIKKYKEPIVLVQENSNK